VNRGSTAPGSPSGVPGEGAKPEDRAPTSRRSRLSRADAVFVSLVWAVFVLPLLLALQFNREPFDEEILGRLRPGMSQAEVHSILGSPGSRERGCWTYARTFAWPILRVHFDPDGRLERVERDR
jgi:hypothetical protein